jgi:hypothetical protein
MTNTLHRFGAPETQRDDYIIFAMPSKGSINEEGPRKLQTFLGSPEARPVNVARAARGHRTAVVDLTPSLTGHAEGATGDCRVTATMSPRPSRRSSTTSPRWKRS